MKKTIINFTKNACLFFMLGYAVLSCKNPFVAGLGEKVDINPPVIVSILPKSGEYIKGNSFTFTVEATDDIKVTRVEMQYRKNSKDEWSTVQMTKSSGDNWICSIDTLQIEDGDIEAKFIAWDGSPKDTSSPAISYIVKNSAPRISLSNPLVPSNFWETFYNEKDNCYDWDEKPFIYLSQDIVGGVFDAQGILAPFPKIKIWDPNKGETENDAEWILMDEYIGGSSWEDRREEDFVSSRNITFLLGTKDLPVADLPYMFRIWAADSSEGEYRLESFYPPLEYPAAEVYIVQSEGPPKLDLFYNPDADEIKTLANPHVSPDYDIHSDSNLSSPFGQEEGNKQKYAKNEPFIIEARARHSSGISKALLSVKDTKGGTETFLKWAQDISVEYNTSIANPNGDPRWIKKPDGGYEREYLFLSLPISTAVPVPIVDENGNSTGSDFTFSEEEYEFTVKILQNGTADEYTERSVIVRINETAPVAEIFVSPFTEEDYSSGYPEYTVNGHINTSWIIDAGVTGIGSDETTGMQLRKYYVEEVTGTSDPPRDDYVNIFNEQDAVFLTANPVHFDTLDIASLLYAPDDVPRTYYFYVAAQDRSGLIDGSVCKIIVDQSSDWPVIDLTQPDSAISSRTLMDNDNTVIKFTNMNDDNSLNTIETAGIKTLNNSMSGNAAILAALSDDDGIDTGSIDLKLYKEGVVAELSGSDKPALPNLASMNNRKAVDFNYKLNELPQGIYYFTFSVKDSGYKKNNTSSGVPFDSPQINHDARQTTLAGTVPPDPGPNDGQVWFVINKEPPEVRVKNSITNAIFIENQSNNAGWPFPLAVEAKSNSGLAAIIVNQRRLDITSSATSPNPGVIIEQIDLSSVPYTAGDFLSRPLLNLPRNPADPSNVIDPFDEEGEYEYTVISVDNTGQIAEKKYIFKLDMGNPVIRTITTSRFQNSPNFNISGKVRDRSGPGSTEALSAITHVYWTLTPDDITPILNKGDVSDPDNPPAPWLTGAVGDEDWSATISRQRIEDALGMASDTFTSGTFWFHVISRDSAGNLSEKTTGASHANWPNTAVPYPVNDPEVGKAEIVIDLTPPVIVFMPAASTYNDVFTFTGTVTEEFLDDIQNPDPDTLSPKIRWTINEGGTGMEGYIGVSGTAPDYTWTWTIPAGAFASLDEGSHIVRIEAMDKAGNTSLKTQSFIKDISPPEIEFININDVRIDKDLWEEAETDPARIAALEAVAQIEDNNPMIRGSFTDEYSSLGFGSAPYSFEYRIYGQEHLTQAEPMPAWSSRLMGSNPGRSLNWTISLTGYNDFWLGHNGIPDGIYWLDIKVSDRLGNEVIIENVVFGVDRQAPEISINTASEAINPSTHNGNHVFGIYSTDVFTLRGTASDANFKEMSVRLNDGTDSLVTGGTESVEITPVQLIKYSWEWTLNAAAYDLLSEGSNTVTFTVYDASGKENSKTWSFIKDTALPTLELLNLDWHLSIPFDDDGGRLQALAIDENGIFSIETKIEKKDNLTSVWSLVPDATGTVSGGFTLYDQAAPGGTLGLTKTFAKPITTILADKGLDLGMGTYRLTIRLTDRADPPNVSLNNVLPGSFTVDADELLFSRGGQLPTLTVHTTVKYANGDNSPENRAFHGVSYDPQPEAVSATAPGFYVTGTASVTNGMQSVQAVLYEGNTEIKTYPPYTDPNPFDQWKWWILIPAADLTDGRTYTVTIIATGDGKSSTQTRDFVWDISPPEISIITPQQLDLVNGSIMVRGTSGDENAVKKLEYMIGKTDSVWNDAGLAPGQSAATNFSGGLYSWSYQFSDVFMHSSSTYSDPIVFNAGNYPNSAPGTIQLPGVPGTGFWQMPFRIRVTDIAGNQTVNNVSYTNSTTEAYHLYLDPDGDSPKAIITYPEGGSRVGGEVRVQGTAEDNNWVYAVLIRTYKGGMAPGNIVSYPVNARDTRVTNADGWALATLSNRGLNVNWSFVINQFGELNSGSGDQQEVFIEVLPIDSKLFDTAATVPDDVTLFTDRLVNLVGSPINIRFEIDSTMPSIENVKIIRVNDTVEYQQGVRTAGEFTVYAELTGANGISVAQWRSGGITKGPMGTGGYDDMIRDGVFAETGGEFVYTAEGARYKIGMPILPESEGGGTALTSSLEMGRKYMIVSGTGFTAYGAANNDPGTMFVATGNGTAAGTAYVAWLGGENNDQYASPPSLENAWDHKFHYPLSITIDSTNSLVGFPINGSSARPSSGNFMLDLVALDNNTPPYRANMSMILQVDNFYPLSRYNAPRNASGRVYMVQGIARDIDTAAYSGSIEGVKEVLAYFKRGTAYYNPYGIEWTTNITAKNIKDMAAGGVIETNFANYPDMDTVLANTSSLPPGTFTPEEIGTGINLYGAAQISRTELSDDNNNGYIEMFSQRGLEIYWGFQFETRNFSDGPIELHYIVIDLAGNATHYVENLYIRNKPPVISGITLTTDLIYNHDLNSQIPESTRYFSPEDRAAYLSTNFNAKNYRLRFDIETVPGTGNGNKTFRVSPVTRGAEIDSTAMVPGMVYTISVRGNTDWIVAGSSSSQAGTTFVCTDPAPPVNADGDINSGKVWPYTGVFNNALDKQVTGIAGDAANIDFGNRNNWTGASNDTEFGETGYRIPDAVSNDALFIVKVFDSTVTSGDTSEGNQQADVILVGMNVLNVDTDVPESLINPFHWNSESDNSIYQNDRNNGHIELEGHLNPAVFNQSSGINDLDPMVSGQISIRGTVTDNNVAGSLWVRMDGFTFGGLTGTAIQTGVQLGIGGTENWYRIADYTPLGGLAGIDQWAANGWKSTVTQISLDQNGHVLDWQLDIDTGRRTAVTALDQTFRIIARDVTGNTQAQDNVQTSAARTAYYRMDIVPYISEVVTKLSDAYKTSPSAFNRSAQGWYPVREDETIEIKGFNFSGTTTAVTVNGTSLNGVAVVGGNTNTHISARVDNNGTAGNSNTIVSGPLVATVNSIASINNIANKDAEYNQEPNKLNNNILDSSRNLYVWNSGYILPAATTATTVAQVYNPFFRMDQNANRLISYGWYPSSGNGRLRVDRNSGANSIDAATANTNRMTNTGLGVNSNTSYTGNTAWYAAGSDITAGDYPYKFAGSTTAGTGINTAAAGVNIVDAIGSNSDRYRIPRIAVQATAATRTSNAGDRILISYFDSTNSRIEVIYGNMGATATSNIPGTPVQVATDATTHSGSMYVTAGFFSNGLPVLAWYDRLNQNLVLSWGNGTPSTNLAAITSTANANSNGTPIAGRLFTYNNHGFTNGEARVVSGTTRYIRVVSANTFMVCTTTGLGTSAIGGNTNADVTVEGPSTSFVATTQAQWQNNAVIIDTFKGSHVDMAIDAGNNIHLAYYDVGNGGLYYALIPPSNGTNANSRPNATNVTPVKVDTYLSAGTKLMINVRNEGTTTAPKYVPYISYAHASFAETRNSIRVAWRTNFTTPGTAPAGTDAQDMFTGNWEVMTVPVGGVDSGNQVIPNIEHFVCNGVPTGRTGWNTAQPTTANLLRGYYAGGTAAGNNRINNTVMVTYMTDRWYEGAVLKHNLWTAAGN